MSHHDSVALVGEFGGGLLSIYYLTGIFYIACHSIACLTAAVQNKRLISTVLLVQQSTLVVTVENDIVEHYY